MNPIQNEADEYRQGHERPLGGYAVLMAFFGALVGLAGAIAAVRGTTSRRISPYDLVLMTAATHKLARIVSKDAVASPLRMPFTRYRDSGAPGEVMEDVRERGQLRHAVGELLTCPFCLSVWIATAFTVGHLFAPALTRLVTPMLTAVAGAGHLQFAYTRAQNLAEGS
jgi:hypothetical protein